jgi:flavin-dependent dehydrogenase
MRRTDVVIIGASLAGAACVRELRRRGIDALAFDRDLFPREKVCGGFLSPGAVNLLDQLGVLSDVRAVGAVEVRACRLRMNDIDVSVPLPLPGLGISRKALDRLMANHAGVQHGAVREVNRSGEGFRVQIGEEVVEARAVIDAAGKLSRFTAHRAAPEFGIQFYQPEPRGDVLDFWFFDDGYGGAVSVEGGRSNACFLIHKEALPRYLNKEDCRVTGPVAYERGASDFIAIGDAAGMVDPFCGEGIRHALDTGLLAAQVVAEGFRKGSTYESMRERYDRHAARRWRGKRRFGRLMRGLLKYPAVVAAGFRLNPEYWLGQLWK